MKAPIDSRQLHAFQTLVSTGSFTKAARELFLTQSAVSHSIRALEEDLGCRLLDRVGKKVMLTQAGEQLLAHAGRILGEMGAARTGLAELGRWGFGRLRVACPAVLADALMPRVLPVLQQEIPRTLTLVEVSDGRPARAWLESRQVDLVLGQEGKPDDRFETVTLFEEDLQIVVGLEHRWARAGGATPPKSDFAQEPFLVPPRGTTFRRLVDDHFAAEGIVLNTPVEMAAVGAALGLVAGNRAATLAPAWMLAGRPGLLALPTGRRRLKRSWVAMHWRGRRLSLAETRFVEECQRAGTGTLRSA